MIKLYIPENEVELTILKSIFEAERVPIYVRNDYYGSMTPGLAFGFENEKTIIVPEEYLDKAKEIIQNYIKNIENDEIKTE